MIPTTAIEITLSEAFKTCQALHFYHNAIPETDKRQHQAIDMILQKIEQKFGIELCERCEEYFSLAKEIGRFADPICPDCQRSLAQSWKPHR